MDEIDTFAASEIIKGNMSGLTHTYFDPLSISFILKDLT